MAAKLRIAQVSPLYESVPPQLYGGTERVVSVLTEELVRQGHDVTLFASGDSITGAALVAPCGRSLRLDRSVVDSVAHHVLEVERVVSMAERFDIIHFHIDHLHYPSSRRLTTAHVTTLHGRLDLADLQPLYEEYSDVPVVSISQSQRAPLPMANWVATVHHGLPLDMYQPRERPDDYLAFLGRVSPEKGLDKAIAIATRLGMKLRIAAKIDSTDLPYFERHIVPLLAHPQIEFLGEIGDADKNAFLGGAKALLFPINWPEPFGLVMIEAMACGTPVIAFRSGSVSEVVDDGLSGFIVDDLDGAIRAVRCLPRIDRRVCRAVFERRFSSTRMAADYVTLYERLISQREASAA